MATKTRSVFTGLVPVLCAALLTSVFAVGADASSASTSPGRPGAITGVWGTGANAATVTVSWAKPGGTYMEYDLFYRIDSGTVWNPAPTHPSTGWTAGPTGVRAESAALTGLDSTKTYVVAVRARDRETGLYGAYGFSGLIEPVGTPGRPVGIRENSRSTTALSVAWDRIADAAGGYEIRVSEATSTKNWTDGKTVAQPSSGTTVLTQLAAADLPASHRIYKTYVVQVRSKSATGTCGTGSVKCSRWVQSAEFAQLDVNGLDLTHVTPEDIPAYVYTLAYDMRFSWDALPSEVVGPTYQVSLYYRAGNPADHYISTDDNSTLHAIPDSWYQDWEWYTLCNDGDTGNDPARGCAKPCSDTWGFADCQRTTPYPQPQWFFNGGPGYGPWINVPSTACKASQSGGTKCSYTFPLAASSNSTVKARVRAVNGNLTGPISEWTNKGVRPPTAPIGIRLCAPSGASVRVEWKAGFSNGADITGYDIALVKAAKDQSPAGTITVSATRGTQASADDPHRCDQSSGSTRYSNPSNPVYRYTFHAVETDRAYSASVAAINSAGTGAALGSESISLTPTAPPAPAPPSVAATATSATLTWEAPADDGGSAVTSYGVRYQRQNADSTWPTDWTVHTRTGTGTTVTETIGSLTATKTYRFQIQACNASGTGGATACGAWSTAVEAVLSSN